MRIQDKVAHVKAAPRSRDHHCHWPGCAARVPPAMWGCKPHWYALPAHLRQLIWTVYVPGQEVTKTPSAAYVDAARQVRAWIAANPQAHPPVAKARSRRSA